MVTYQYYTGTYLGDYFTKENAFLRAETKACLELAHYVVIPQTPSENMKKCVCAMSELIDKFESTEDKILKGIYQETVSGYSVSYGSSSERISRYRTNMQDLIEMWLGDVINQNANYRGVSRHVL